MCENKTNFEKVNNIFNCKLKLEDSSEFIIPMREDGYISATKLCKAVGKKPSHWLSLKETKELVKKLEKSDAGIATSQLIEIYKGNSSQYSQGTWIHPDLGIQLAQWCSPNFSIQVSKWIRELIITGKVEVGKEKTNDELKKELDILKKQLDEKNQIIMNNQTIIYDKVKELENTNTNKELGFLENKFIRFQKRQKYSEKDVVYIITNEDLKKDRIYLIGKAVDLKKRMTNYNKSLEHEVIYYKGFKNMYHMKTAEMMLLYKLNKYRYELTSKKDKFILPEDEDISLFTDVLDQCVKWFENIENIVVDEETEIISDTVKKNCSTFKKNTVYMLSSKIHLKKRTYIIGKSKNLTSRLSGYNKGITHVVMYFKKCNNECQMSIIESMILYKLDEFRKRANRDRFILPEGKDDSFFKNVFDDAINWFEDIDQNLKIIKDKETIIQERKDNKLEYRELNSEKIYERGVKYPENNKEKLSIKQKEYRKNHKKEISDWKKDWYNKNKENVINRVKQNYENNKTEKLIKVKEYASKNKDKIKTRNSITVECECGSVVRKYAIKKHLITMKHNEFIKNNKKDE